MDTDSLTHSSPSLIPSTASTSLIRLAAASASVCECVCVHARVCVCVCGLSRTAVPACLRQRHGLAACVHKQTRAHSRNTKAGEANKQTKLCKRAEPLAAAMPVFYSPLSDMQTSLGGSVFTNNRTADGDFTRKQEDTSGWLAVTSCRVDGGGRGRGFIGNFVLNWGFYFVCKS